MNTFFHTLEFHILSPAQISGMSNTDLSRSQNFWTMFHGRTVLCCRFRLFVVSTVQTLKIIYQEFSCENSPVHVTKIQLELNL